MTHKIVFLRGRTDDGGEVQRVLLVRNALHMEHGILSLERIESSVIAEGTFGAHLAYFDVAFEDDFSIRGNFQVYRLACDQFHWISAQEAGEEEFVHVGRNWQDSGESRSGVCANRDGDLQFAARI